MSWIQLSLTHYPYPWPSTTNGCWTSPTWSARHAARFMCFEFGLRAVALQVISQYMQHDINDIPDPAVNLLLSTRIDKATLGVWRELLFTTLNAYDKHRDRLACPELADLCWERDTGSKRQGVQGSFVRLIEIRNRLAHRLPPQTEEEWRSLYGKVSVDLRTVLDLFSFLQNYDLVLCRQGLSGRESVFFTGLEPRLVPGDLPAGMPPVDHEFYLRRKDGQYLIPLHPLIIHWQPDPQVMASGLTLSDAALYDSFTTSTIHYLATVLWQNVEIERGDETFQQFFGRIGGVLERIRTVRRQEHRLTWQVLEDVARSIVEDRMGTTEDRYDPALYLPREPVRRAFDDFLSTEGGKPAFVLLGSSGVGKSCFVLSLVEEYQGVDECCIVIRQRQFSGGRQIDRVLTAFQQLPGDHRTRRPGSTAFSKRSAASRRQPAAGSSSRFAINEHEAPDKLLRQTLVEGLPTWLKVVLTTGQKRSGVETRKDLDLTLGKYYRIQTH